MDRIVYSTQLKKDSTKIKLFNVDAFSKLDKSGLSHSVIERRLLLKEFDTGEKLYIQYPGKETAREKNPRPWDFRPKMLLPNGEWLKDLSFKDVWDDLYSIKDSNVDMSLLATIFFRIAYTLDLKLVKKMVEYEDVDMQTGKIVNRGNFEFSWYEYNPELALLNQLNIPPSAIRNCHLLPYLSYNDYLAQNEDCKYYYRAKYERNEDWTADTGRRNTLLTHMAVIAFIEGLLSFTEIMDMFQRGMGVAPLSPKLWEAATKGKIVK